jgi:AraC family transcriptional regulator
MRLSDQIFGDGAVVRTPSCGRVRCVRHGDLQVDLEHADEVALVLNVTGTHRVSGRFDGVFRAETPPVNSVTIMPPGCRVQFEIEGWCRILAVTIPVGRPGWNIGGSLEPKVNTVDPELSGLIWRAATSDGDRVASALMLLEQHLVSSTRRKNTGYRKGGMAPVRLRHVLDFIEASPGKSPPLSELAAVARMSVFHFARAFAQSTGSPPHRYVVDRRVARAMAALEGSEPIQDVADRCGFANASHLSGHVRRMTGLTPSELRRRVLN